MRFVVLHRSTKGQKAQHEKALLYKIQEMNDNDTRLIE